MGKNFRKTEIRLDGASEKLLVSYDQKYDILDLHVGKPKPAISTEVAGGVWVRHDIKTHEIVGMTIEKASAVLADTKSYIKQLKEIERDARFADKVLHNQKVVEYVEA